MKWGVRRLVILPASPLIRFHLRPEQGAVEP